MTAQTEEVGWLEKVKWDANGLVPVIAQESTTGDVLMFAWMNREALAKTIELKRAVYYSRSRQRLWFKGEESGHVQHVHEVRLDCDEDVVLLKVEQVSGIACHTGRHSCFFQKFEGSVETGDWVAVEPVLTTPNISTSNDSSHAFHARHAAAPRGDYR